MTPAPDHRQQRDVAMIAKTIVLLLVEACVLIAAYMTAKQVIWMFTNNYVPGPSPRNSETMKFEDREPEEPPTCDPKANCPICQELRGERR